MKNRVIYLLASSLTMLSIILASCAPAPATTTGTPTAAPTTSTEVTTTTAAPTTSTGGTLAPGVKELLPWLADEVKEKPKYGGTAVVALSQDVQGFDRTIQTSATWHINAHLVYEELLTGDMAMGPLGTNKVDFTGVTAGYGSLGFITHRGIIAESWETPDDQTLIYHIRKGIHWQNKPPVNGRELTADDVVYSLRREYNFDPKIPNPYNYTSRPFAQKVIDIYVDPKDPWAVVFKVEAFAPAFIEDTGDKSWIVPHEVVDKYGDFKDWHNAVGTGPFMLTDYVPGSSLNFVRNPDWWWKMPVGPSKDDQLPYLDGVKALVIQDTSTLMAGMRTGKIDTITGAKGQVSGGWSLGRDDFNSLMKTNPELHYRKTGLGQIGALGMKATQTDPLGTPFLDQRVRWALSMAINREAISRDYYSGQTADPSTPFGAAFPPGSPYNKPVDEQVKILETVHGIKPEEAIMLKKMMEYHPDEAKKLLADAGYPTGFKTSVITTAGYVDVLSIIKSDLAKVNIDMALDVKEATVYSSLFATHGYPGLIGGVNAAPTLGSRPEKWLYFLPGKKGEPFAAINILELYNPVVEKAMEATFSNYGDFEKRSKILYEAYPYVAWLGWGVHIPTSYQYDVWQPWLKLYTGEATFGMFNAFNFLGWIWYDQDLKKKMGY